MFGYELMKAECVEDFGITVKTPVGNKVDRFFVAGEVYAFDQCMDGSVFLCKMDRIPVIIDGAVFARNFRRISKDGKHE